MPTRSNLPAVLKSKIPKVYKNKKLNNANFAAFGLNDYQVFLHIVSKLDKLDAEGKYLQPEKLQREHTITALEFAAAFNVDPKNAYDIIKKAGKKLREAFVRLEKPELFETWEINVLSRVEYQHKEGKITIKFTDDIMPYLAQVQQKFVMYNLKEVASFGSLYTTRLYELIQEFKDTGYIIKSIEELRELFAVGNTLSLYSNFKAKTFQHAINEINAKTDYNITFTEIKTGRKVTSIEFSFKKTIVEKRFKPDGTQVNNYIKPKHNSDKIEAAKAIEAPKKPAPIIMQKPQKPHNPVAVEAIKNIQNMFLQKKINDAN
jgi:plasmid replication initiation protein